MYDIFVGYAREGENHVKRGDVTSTEVYNTCLLRVYNRVFHFPSTFEIKDAWGGSGVQIVWKKIWWQNFWSLTSSWPAYDVINDTGGQLPDIWRTFMVAVYFSAAIWPQTNIFFTFWELLYLKYLFVKFKYFCDVIMVLYDVTNLEKWVKIWFSTGFQRICYCFRWNKFRQLMLLKCNKLWK